MSITDLIYENLVRNGPKYALDGHIHVKTQRYEMQKVILCLSDGDGTGDDR